MEIKMDDLIQKIEAEFENMEPGTLKPETSFRDLNEWNSMHALILIALVDTEYDITLTGNDLRNISTVSDLYQFILSKKQ